jgi:sulfite reductase beta subunit-like hemoprotein
LQVHQAADGALARVRLPGGMLTPGQLGTLAGVAEEFGSATLELTARGNLQIRGISDPAAVADTIGVLLKYHEDIARMQGGEAQRLLQELATAAGRA